MSSDRNGPSGFPRWEKDPQAKKDYTLDWSVWLGADTIVSCDWYVPADLVKESFGHNTTHTTVWISGGTSSQTYQVQCKVTTAAGRIDSRTIEILVRQQ